MDTTLENELDQLEQQQRADEQSLEVEVSTLRSKAAELELRAAAAIALAEQVEAVSGQTPVARRLRSVAAPTIFGETAQERARQAREKALKTRREAATQLRQMLSVSRRAIEELVKQVDDDEREARQCLAGAEAEAQAQRDAAAAPSPAGATALSAELPVAAMEAAVESAEEAGIRQRQCERVPVHTSVDFTTDDNFFMGFSANISDGGIFVATLNTLPTGTEVDLKFKLPTGVVVNAHGVVRWTRELSDLQVDLVPGIGVQFSDLEDAQRDAIHSFIQQRDPMFYVD